MSNSWNTSVKELIIIFRGALLAVIPWIEKAKIKWKEGEAYDDWDNIIEALYSNILCSSLTGEIASDYNIPKYNINYDTYSTMNYIGVRDIYNSDRKYAFISFQSNILPLDIVKVAELDNLEKVVGCDYLKIENIEFVFVKSINGKREVLDSIEVEL